MNNVIEFRGRARRFCTPGQADLANDLLAMSNYLEQSADATGWPLWAEGMARELRAMARQVGK